MQISDRSQQWIEWILHLVSSVVIGVFLIPLCRTPPEPIRSFIFGLDSWQQNLFVFVACILLFHTIFSLFAPNWRHLQYLLDRPPIWTAWFLGGAVLFIIDVTAGLSSNAYTASSREWIGFGGGALLVVILFRYLTSHGESQEDPIGIVRSLDDDASLDWDLLEKWLQCDTPAIHDFLENYPVAKRLKGMLEQGTRSIGIVGPFGAGKTSIVNWIDGLIASEEPKRKTRILVSKHSCWGFESSSSSIEAMLSDAIEAVTQRIDTFQIGSLPESYRQTFSAGGHWLDLGL